ncbi:ScbR family autoregulator-binding transcription factor [Amycolatopsis sp. H20-H5]|uniref:ScbR family autoregulator-binding transcription factor n=1 Tax=Amycolatopsis sp. H20-H5 TaxID=3046309 RepID=UPI002DBA265F|nr:ScbR family autoregulator-binding transcription factor [Amycolatopsis sp. H20-H5]MEC3976058.1 ScbR family autoregulator-binding transcription factor [Amycolatopsis sp. H20-H5]
MARQLRSEVTRGAIVRGAAEAFDRFGYGGTSLSEVIAQAGVTKGALYFHFGSKEDLARAVIAEQQAWSAGEYLEGGAPGLEAVIRLTQLLAGRLTTDPIMRAGVRLTLENGTFGGALPDPHREWIDVTEQLLRRAAAEGDLRASVDPAALARFVVGAFTGVQILSQVLTGRADLRARLREMWELLLPSVVPESKVSGFRSVLGSVTGSVTGSVLGSVTAGVEARARGRLPSSG